VRLDPNTDASPFGNGGEVGALSAESRVQTSDRLAPRSVLIRERQREPVSVSEADLAKRLLFAAPEIRPSVSRSAEAEGCFELDGSPIAFKLLDATGVSRAAGKPCRLHVITARDLHTIADPKLPLIVHVMVTLQTGAGCLRAP